MLIGLSGKARSGKDTVAQHLSHDAGFFHYAFATPLKDMIQNIFGLSDEQMYGDLKETPDPILGKTPRWLCQYIGGDIFRGIYEHVWAECAIRKYRELQKSHRETLRVVISDVRYPNEFTAIRSAGGYLWRIIRTDYEEERTGNDEHESETGLDDLPDCAFDSVLTAASGDLKGLLEESEKALDKTLQVHAVLSREEGK